MEQGAEGAAVSLVTHSGLKQEVFVCSHKGLGKSDKSLPSFVQSGGQMPSHHTSECLIPMSSQCYCTVPKLGELQMAAQRRSSVS